ncbi:pantoate--beta-alanine ligase [Cerasicoccus arenae]|uniref:Pantothenate synthetase n=1 Tax=Cerasicoccus arenae TaxID=424488 RepID=A0A8J3GFE2_9BACT|nr:pantoate--beta-alanine ligase [Cerasicoccus arenae]MBK1859415.1 pantoate--beta-alanine ligase [Cerasicoccus arenae]GHC10865.1 pantothenate synthetase [Cerasicoccus arenae]
MEIISSVQEMQSQATRLRGQGRLIGFAPTMGALHEGHLSLIDIVREKSDVVIVSIFVNPTQFGPNEDFDRYPRPLEADLAACEAHGADIVFAPSRDDLLPPNFSTYVEENSCSQGLCGISRPGHFRGVSTIVAILFNVCRPDFAVFGQKDAQQAAVIKKMVTDLNFPVEIIIAPTVREPDGLAMSSRNRYLDPGQRQDAARLSQALVIGKEIVAKGNLSVDRIKAEVTHHLSQSRRIRIIYVEIVDPDSMKPERAVRPGQSLLTVAVWLEQTRLIDNMTL